MTKGAAFHQGSTSLRAVQMPKGRGPGQCQGHGWARVSLRVGTAGASCPETWPLLGWPLMSWVNVVILFFFFFSVCENLAPNLFFKTKNKKLFYLYWSMGFPGGSDGKESAYNAGDPCLIPVLRKSPGEGNGNPLQYFFF